MVDPVTHKYPRARKTPRFQFNQVALRRFETAIHAERDEAMSSHLDQMGWMTP